MSTDYNKNFDKGDFDGLSYSITASNKSRFHPSNKY